MSNRAHRFPAKYPVMLRQGPDMLSATICNISTGGACLLGTTSLGKGDTLVLDYAIGQTRATVMWHIGQMAGVKFEDALSVAGVAVIRSDAKELRRA